MRQLFLVILLAVAALCPAQAQEEAVETTNLDTRTREVAETLRCIVCKNQSIEESDAQLARDLKALVRERLEAGDTNEEAQAYVVARYGEFVLLKPTFSWKNLGLWIAPFLVLFLALGGGLAFILSRKKMPALSPSLSPEERAELEQYLGRED